MKGRRNNYLEGERRRRKEKEAARTEDQHPRRKKKKHEWREMTQPRGRRRIKAA